MRIILVLLAGILISVLYSAFTVDSAAWGAFSQFPFSCVVALVAMIVLPWLTDTLRWQVWLRFLGQRHHFGEVFRMTLAAEMVSAVTPTAVGGGYAKLGWMVTRGMAPGVAASVMILGSLEDFVFFVLALPLLVLLSASARDALSLDRLWHFLQQRELISIQGASTLIVCVIAVYWGGRLIGRRLPSSMKTRVSGLWEKIKQQLALAKQTLQMIVMRGGWRFFMTVGLAGVRWACRLSILTVVLAGMHQQVDPVKFFASQWLVFTLLNLVPSPGATGGAEVAFVLFYGSLVPENLLGLILGAWRVFTFTLPVGLATALFIFLLRWNQLYPCSLHETLNFKYFFERHFSNLRSQPDVFTSSNKVK